MPSTFLYEESEKILCFHGPLMYEAKVLKREKWVGKKDAQDGFYYKVHYKGWKNTWDEWIPESRALKLNEKNLAKQAELFESSKQSKLQVKTEKPTETAEKKKRRRESTSEKEETPVKRPEIELLIPDALKLKLVEDWEAITKGQQLLSLPRKPTVSDILNQFRDDYLANSRKKANRDNDVINEVVEGLKFYFDRALGNVLLYRFERPQYLQLKKDKTKRMSNVYGIEHLLRLFVQLPMLISHTNMDQDAVNILKDHFALLVVFIQKHFANYFTGEYELATPEYLSMMED